ncbi:MAG: ribonuclease HII [Pseudomonadota bacterium]
MATRISEAPTFEFEDAHEGRVAGIDEAGRGPWAGPVVAAAVVLTPEMTPPGLHDSKTLSEKRRIELAASLKASGADIGIGVASVEEIDRLNILQATFLAMARAEAALVTPPDICLVDGSQKPTLKAPARMIVKGDMKSLSIAAASIIAKTTRDDMMYALAEDFPHYGWESNKGYGAPAHREGLDRYGVTPHHRMSFKPIRDRAAKEVA